MLRVFTFCILLYFSHEVWAADTSSRKPNNQATELFCVSQLEKTPVYGNLLKEFFEVSLVRLEKSQAIGLKWISQKQFSLSEHKNFYYSIVEAFDHLLIKNECSPLVQRLVVIYPSISYSISSKELQVIRKFAKNKHLWNSHVLMRTIVEPLN